MSKQDTQIESAAKAIYNAFQDAENHPWVEGGNSKKQDEARRYARTLFEKPLDASEFESVAPYYHLNGTPANFTIDADLGQLVLACHKALDFVINGPGVLTSQKIIDEQFKTSVVDLHPRVKVLIENRITVKYTYSKLVDMTFEQRGGLAKRPNGYTAMECLKHSVDQLHSPACRLSIMMSNCKVERDVDTRGMVDELARLNEFVQQIMLMFGLTRDDIELASRKRMDKMLDRLDTQPGSPLPE